jgi:hypothetical protein
MRSRDVKILVSTCAIAMTIAIGGCDEKSGDEAKPAEGDKPAVVANPAEPASPEAAAADAAKATITPENAVDEAAKLAAEIEKDEVDETDE